MAVVYSEDRAVEIYTIRAATGITDQGLAYHLLYRNK